MNSTNNFTFVSILLFTFGFGGLCPHAEAGLERIKTAPLGEVEYVYYRYRNTTKHPITVQLRVHNNMVYNKKSKTWSTKSLKFPPFSLKPGEVKEGLTYAVPRGQGAQIEEVGSRESRGEQLAEYQPGSYRNATQAERDAAARRKQLPTPPPPPQHTVGVKPLIGSWNVSRALYSFESQSIIRLEIEPTGSGSWHSHQVFRNGDTSTTVWDAQVTTDAPDQWKLHISNCRKAGGRGRRGRDFTMTIQRSSSSVLTGKSPRSNWLLSR
jgi:hypothetical protein